MIALDTNLLVRVITRDDPAQAARAAQLMKAHRLFLPKTVILEVEWVLRYTYEFDPAAINRALSTLIALENLEVEDGAGVRRAIEWHQAGMDFADALHLASSERAQKFATFDRAMAKRANRAKATPPIELLQS